jgi:hypothetical protein
VLVGEADGALAAMASATLDRNAALGFIDVLSVSRGFQGQGFGREMLRGMIEHLLSIETSVLGYAIACCSLRPEDSGSVPARPIVSPAAIFTNLGKPIGYDNPPARIFST